LPKLSSGRLVGFNAEPFEDLLEDIFAGKDWAVLELMEINDRKDLYAYLEILYYVDGNSSEQVVLIPGSNTPPPNTKPLKSGLRVTDVISPSSDWPLQDKSELIELVTSESALKVLDDLLARANQVKSDIKSEGSPMQNLEASMYKCLTDWDGAIAEVQGCKLAKKGRKKEGMN
jgi:hypothetical protein